MPTTITVYIRSFLFMVFTILCASRTMAQYMIAIDAASERPFSIAWSGKSMLSSREGHLILPNLPDSPFNLVFKTGDMPTEEFIIRLDGLKRDRGFILQKISATQWSLFDWQNLEIINALQSFPAQLDTSIVNTSNAFAMMMASNVNDPTVLEPLAKNPSAKNTPIGSASPREALPQAATKIKEAVIKNEVEMASPLPLPKEINATEAIGTNSVILRKDSTSTRMRQLTYQISKGKDPAEAVQVEIELTVDTNKSVSTDTALLVKAVEPLPVATNQINRTPADDRSHLPQVPLVAMINSDCKSIASDEEVRKLHTKMLRADRATQRIEVAAKFFKGSCIRTEQLKILSNLFFAEEDLYLFLETAYPFVSDTDQFKTLLELFINDQFRSKFKALARVAS